jgi:hypothetical protein
MAKSFKQYGESKKNFFTTIDKKLSNTLLFENCSIIESYNNDKIKYYDKTEKGLYYFTNIVMEKYRDFIVETSDPIELSTQQRINYEFNPYLLSYDNFGTPDYWWIILLANRKTSIFDFTKLPSIIKLPNISQLKNKLKYEMQNNSGFGYIFKAV